jgi:tripartite-type tricarboxylate transporter receptor subunit TctC
MTLRRRQFLHLAAGSCVLPVVPRRARAQSYPTHPIRLMVPFPPGGGYDAIARPWSEKIKPLFGTVVVENQGGGGGSLAAATVARARPDGYTILLGGSTTHVTEAILKSRPLYDPLKDLEPIFNIAVSAFALGPTIQVLCRTIWAAPKSSFCLRCSSTGMKATSHAPVVPASVRVPELG